MIHRWMRWHEGASKNFLRCLLIALACPVACDAAGSVQADASALILKAKQGHLSPDELKQAEAFAQANPQKPESHVLLSTVLAQQGFTDLANQEIETAWRLNPDDPRPLFALLKIYSEKNEGDALLRLSQEAHERYKGQALPLLKTAALLQLFKLYKLSMPLLDDPSIASATNAAYLVPRMYSLYHNGRLGEAGQLSQKLAQDPASRVHAAYVGGLIALHAGQSRKALELLRTAYKLANNDPEVVSALFSASLACNSEVDAIGSGFNYLSVVAGTKSQTPVKQKLARFLRNKDPQTYIKFASDIGLQKSTQSGAAYYYFAVGDLMDDIGRQDLAVGFYCRGLILDPTYGRAYMRLGRDLEAVGNPEDALKCFVVAAMKSGGDREVASNLVRANQRRNNFGRDIAARMQVGALQQSRGRITLPPQVNQLLADQLGTTVSMAQGDEENRSK